MGKNEISKFKNCQKISRSSNRSRVKRAKHDYAQSNFLDKLAQLV